MSVSILLVHFSRGRMPNAHFRMDGENGYGYLYSKHSLVAVRSITQRARKTTKNAKNGEWSNYTFLLGLHYITYTYTHTHTHLTALFPGLPGWAGTRKVKPIWILLKQETVSGSGISWVCKCAPRSRQITMPALPPLYFLYRTDALPAAQLTTLHTGN